MKKVKIECCNDCPHMDNEYYTYNGECDFLSNNGKFRDLSNEINLYQDIHHECPLENWYEDTEKLKEHIKELEIKLNTIREYYDKRD